MTWQGVTQYTIGFGRSATTWTGGPVWDSATDNNYGAGYSTLVNGGAHGWTFLIRLRREPSLKPGSMRPVALCAQWPRSVLPARTAEALTSGF